MSASLEEQRRALLEQIEASRAVYRRMLTGESALESSRLPLPARTTSGTESVSPARIVTTGSHPAQLAANQLGSGRGKAVQWAMDHPLWVATGVALLVLLAPRVIEAGRRRTQARASAAHAQAVPQVQSSGAGRALLAAALLLMRDPARLQAAGRLVGVGWRWLQRWRGQSATTAVPPSSGRSSVFSRWLH